MPKKILITGGTSGLGNQLVIHFLNSGYEVYTTGRDSSKLAGSDERLHFIRMEFSDLKDVGEKTLEILRIAGNIDIVINNAGILSPPEFKLTRDNTEYSFQVNFLSHLLIDEIIVKNSDSIKPVFVVSVTSPVYKYVNPVYALPVSKHYIPFQTYSESKRYLLFIGEHLLKKYPGKNVIFFGFNPGIFRSGIYRTQNNWFHKLYYAGAPLMKMPAGVARKLGNILEQKSLINGAIYSNTKRFRKIQTSHNEKIENFMDICNNITAPFVN